ncbi:hypothetical protein Dimus_020696 [Dionaea muscipula]
MKFPYIYPDPENRQLRASLADDSGLGSDYILAGYGADELIYLIMRCVLDPGDKIVDCPPTFTMYESDANVNGVVVLKVPRNSDFSLNVKNIAKVVEHSSKPEIEEQLVVIESDFEHLFLLVEKKDGGPSWIQVMDRSTSTMSYRAWRRDPESGPPQYRSSIIYEDVTLEIMRDFF